MQLYVLARNPTDSLTDGFLPAARRLGLTITLLTDQPERYPTQPDVELVSCDVHDFRAVISSISRHRRPHAIFSNSDHLQTQTALAADYFDLPGKDWRTTWRTKDKAQMRRHLATGPAPVWHLEIPAGHDPADLLHAHDVPLPCVVKPREGVASEDVLLVEDLPGLLAWVQACQERRPGSALLVEEYCPGQLCTLETLGDGTRRHVLGGFQVELSAPPHFIEQGLSFVPAHPEPVVTQVLAQLDLLGVGFGICHTEFVVHAGQARIVEVNYRAIGDQCDLLLADLLKIPLFELVLRTHLGEALPPDLRAHADGAAAIRYAYATSPGTLAAAPGPVDLTVDDVSLTYRPLRAVGETHPRYGSNRDYLGVVRAVGTKPDQVEHAAADFLAARQWTITA